MAKKHLQKGPRKNANSSEGDVALAAGNVTIHDQKMERREGGDLHQLAEGDTPVLTTAQGAPVADDQNSLRLGARGPLLMDDFHFREKNLPLRP